MKTFAQFSGDLDDTVKEQFAFGRALTEILVQPLRRPYEEWEEVVILTASLKKVTVGLDPEEIRPFFDGFLKDFRIRHTAVVANIENGKTLSDEDEAIIVAEAKKLLAEKNV